MKNKKELCPVMRTFSYLIATSSSAASSPIASQIPGMPIASEKNRQQDECRTKLIRRSVDVSSATQGCKLWRVDGRAAERPVARRRKLRRL